MKLLIVDDSSMIRNAISYWANEIGIEIVGEAKNGVEAVEMTKTLKPGLITLDITMPELNGLEALEQIKALDDTIKVIIISALSDKSIALEAMNKGAENFINKPFSEEDLKEAIEEVME